MEFLIISILSFGLGWGTSEYFDEEIVCKKIVFNAPDKVLKPIQIQDCKQGSPSTHCPIKYPRFVLSEEEYIKDIDNGIEVREYLNECIETIERYNEDKSVTY